MIEKQLMKIINKKNLELLVKFIFSKKASKIKISNFCALSRKQETCSCRPGFSSMGRNDESTLFFYGSN